jgi:pimeloyl-ACP methyl ester carboxylesterase
MRKTSLFPLFILSWLLVVSGCSVQNSMLYYPSTEKPSPSALASQGVRFWEPAQSGDYRGYTGTARIDRVKGTIIVFHGNAGGAADRTYYIQALEPLGYRVILAEYPGYGGRKGKLGEASFVGDAKETVRIASEQSGKPIYLLGESLGCGVAAAVAGQSKDRIRGVILITPWDTLLSVAKEKFPWLPVQWFLTDTYDSVGNLKAFPGRIAIAGSERDEVIPVHHAQTLFKSLAGEKRMWLIKGAGHNDWIDLVGPVWWREITDYVAASDAAAAKPPAVIPPDKP